MERRRGGSSTRYEPNTAPRMHSVMTSILALEQLPSDLHGYETAIGRWEELIRRWETMSSESFNDGMKRAIFLNRAPTTVRAMLQLQAVTSYAQLSALALQFLQANAKYEGGVATDSRRGAGRGDAMEIDALTKRKGKGSNKGKQPADASWKKEAECWTCGKKGHVSTECWHAAEKGKGKSTPKGGQKGKKSFSSKGKKGGVNELVATGQWIWVDPTQAQTAGSMSSAASLAPTVTIAQTTSSRPEQDWYGIPYLR